MNCPGFERLIDYLDGHLNEKEAEEVKVHLARGCPECVAEREWYEQVKAVAFGDDMVEPPSWVAKRAIKLFETRSSPSGVREKLSRLVASLIFDSFSQPMIEGVRSTATMNRQLLYRADNYSIDLQISLSEQPGADLVGQILRKDDLRFESVSCVALDLLQEGETVCSTTTNETGEFHISSVSFGEYDLRIDLREVSITVAGLPVAQLN